MSLVNMTPNAVQNIKRLQRSSTFWIWSSILLVVAALGTNTLELEEDPEEDDNVFDFDGVRVSCTQTTWKSYELDHRLGGFDHESGFQIDNPQAKRPVGAPIGRLLAR